MYAYKLSRVTGRTGFWLLKSDQVISPEIFNEVTNQMILFMFYHLKYLIVNCEFKRPWETHVYTEGLWLVFGTYRIRLNWNRMVIVRIDHFILVKLGLRWWKQPPIVRLLSSVFNQNREGYKHFYFLFWSIWCTLW